MKSYLYKSLLKVSEKRRTVLNRIDRRLTRVMDRIGHTAERRILAILFFWFGTLKLIGQTSASSIIAKSIYFASPEIMVPILGAWEVIIGVSLLFRDLHRIAILLLLIRLPGSALALVLQYEVCFDGSVFLPTIQGQYLLKELTLLGAALVIGSTVRHEEDE